MTINDSNIISDLQRNNLCATLADITHKWMLDESIVCIYFTEINTSSTVIINVTLVKNGNVNDNDMNQILGENKKYQSSDSINNLGLILNISVISFSRFFYNKNTINTFSDSIILFDRIGEFMKMKNNFDINVNDKINRKKLIK